LSRRRFKFPLAIAAQFGHIGRAPGWSSAIRAKSLGATTVLDDIPALAVDPVATVAASASRERRDRIATWHPVDFSAGAVPELEPMKGITDVDHPCP
jgi:hypothetical protein